MTVRDQHVPMDRLTALAFVARAPQDRSPENAEDNLALEHIARCDDCAASFVQLTADADGLREFAFARADEVFDDAMLDAQRTRILDRLAHLGQTARVITFPRRSREVAMSAPVNGRRWISVAAAAGLIIGLVAGQMLHFVPSMRVAPRGDEGISMQAADRPAPMVVPASNSYRVLSDEELMEEVEAAVQLRRAHALQAIDALTPTAAEMLTQGR